jgi:hypothetical protein
MRLFNFARDGGPESKVWGFYFIEIKSLFSIALLCFEHGSREAYHDHAFNSVSWVLRGSLTECILDGFEDFVAWHLASWRPIITRRSTIHKVVSAGRTWVLTFRGPWTEYHPATNETLTPTHGRRVVGVTR